MRMATRFIDFSANMIYTYYYRLVRSVAMKCGICPNSTGVTVLVPQPVAITLGVQHRVQICGECAKNEGFYCESHRVFHKFHRDNSHECPVCAKQSHSVEPAVSPAIREAIDAHCELDTSSKSVILEPTLARD